MRFIGREEQIRRINREIRADENRNILIYGRRRIGKSELIKQVLLRTETKSIYYECKQISEAGNTESLSAMVSETFRLPRLGYQKIEDLLCYVFEMAKTEKIILVLDEYPYLRESVRGLDSILQGLIDRYRDQSNLTFILLGSYVDVMKSMLEPSNPLYGRIDLTINLQQMDYYEAAQFYPNYSEEDKVRIYSVFGGIPYYNRYIDDSLSVRENIIELIASEGARLENEISMYLNSEIRKIVNANEIFDALARGYSRYSDILSQSHVSSGPTMLDVLDKLIRMEVVEKTAPINDENNRRKVGYSICDNLSMFYYRYIFRHLSQQKLMDSEVFYDRYIAEDFETFYVPHQFERICRQFLIRKNKAGAIDPVFTRIGKYYYDDSKNRKNGEFDLVTEDENGYVFYEVKFRSQPVTDSMIREEILQVKETGFSCNRYVFISRSGFTGQETAEIKHIHLKDLYQE